MCMKHISYISLKKKKGQHKLRAPKDAYLSNLNVNICPAFDFNSRSGGALWVGTSPRSFVRKPLIYLIFINKLCPFGNKK